MSMNLLEESSPLSHGWARFLVLAVFPDSGAFSEERSERSRHCHQESPPPNSLPSFLHPEILSPPLTLPQRLFMRLFMALKTISKKINLSEPRISNVYWPNRLEYVSSIHPLAKNLLLLCATRWWCDLALCYLFVEFCRDEGKGNEYKGRTGRQETLLEETTGTAFIFL